MEFYHVLNRGVDKRNIFLDDGDCIRFIHDMFAFNTKASANNTTRTQPMNDFVSRSLEGRKPIVNIHGWCLMGNHYHLLVSEENEGALTLFSRRLNVGYAKFFNEKYKRTGTLFEGRTKKVHIDSDAHFLHILHYIHLNPLDFLKGAEQWRELEIQNATTALRHLDHYRWSSFRDYCGAKNFPSILTTDFFRDLFGNYRKTLTSYLKDVDIETRVPFLLE